MKITSSRIDDLRRAKSEWQSEYDAQKAEYDAQESEYEAEYRRRALYTTNCRRLFKRI